jgi:hypothetical protein
LEEAWDGDMEEGGGRCGRTEVVLAESGNETIIIILFVL